MLVILHALGPLMLSQQKPLIVSGMLEMLRDLATSRLAYVMWATTDSPASSGIRENRRSELATYWRTKIAKRIELNPDEAI
mmetsp:Transcript_2900/g.4410  ORF Transcript_2900/g.4410 Transcript_2900/m.4410 type:complete len:81 (+) Transcript_2900:403-645(+)